MNSRHSRAVDSCPSAHFASINRTRELVHDRHSRWLPRGDATADCNHGVTGSLVTAARPDVVSGGHQGSIPARVRRFHSLIEQNTCKVCRLTEYWTSITEAGLLHYCCSSCACSDVLEIAWLLKPALSREISRHQLKNVQTR